MSRIDAINQYHAALKAGLKYYNARVAAHLDPYPEVLEDQINETQASGHALIGTIEIPSEYIVGTLAAGRKTAFRLVSPCMTCLSATSGLPCCWRRPCFCR